MLRACQKIPSAALAELAQVEEVDEEGADVVYLLVELDVVVDVEVVEDVDELDLDVVDELDVLEDTVVWLLVVVVV